MKLRLALLLSVALLPAARAAEPAVAPTEITSQQLDMKSSDEEATFVFTGLVTVRGTNIELTCDRLEVVALRSDKDTKALGQMGRFKRMLATGRVKIVQGDRVATCGRAEVLPGEEKITLTENPLVRDGDSTVAGEPITLYRGERRAVVENPKITLPPLKDLGYDKDKAPKTP